MSNSVPAAAGSNTDVVDAPVDAASGIADIEHLIASMSVAEAKTVPPKDPVDPEWLDEEKFFADFAKAFQKLTELGFKQ